MELVIVGIAVTICQEDSHPPPEAKLQRWPAGFPSQGFLELSGRATGSYWPGFLAQVQATSMEGDPRDRDPSQGGAMAGKEPVMWTSQASEAHVFKMKSTSKAP